MNKTPPPAEPSRAWQRTVVGELSLPVLPPAPPVPQRRPAIQGLDVRELESESVFDRLFGDETAPAK